MESKEDTIKITSAHPENIQTAYGQFASRISAEPDNILPTLTPVIRGLSSHDPQTRTGYAALLTLLLRKHKDQIDEHQASEHVEQFSFTKKQKKSALRTSAIGATLCFVCFVESGIFHSEEIIKGLIIELFHQASQRQSLQPFIYKCLVQIIITTHITDFDFFKAEVPNTLNGLFFWFSLSTQLPNEQKDHLPEIYRNPFSDASATNTRQILQQEKQPWNSAIWEFIVCNIPESQLPTFWAQSVLKTIRTDQSAHFALLMITKNIFPYLTEDKYQHIISSAFIKSINKSFANPLYQLATSEFLEGIFEQQPIHLILDSFSYIDARLPCGFDFHKKLFARANEEELIREYEKLKDTSENTKHLFTNYVSSPHHSTEGYKDFRLAKLRALLISTSLKPLKELSLNIFNTLRADYEDQLRLLSSDLVDFDSQRIEGAATLADLTGNPELSHFEACFALNNILTGNTDNPPQLPTDQTVNLIQMSAGHAKDTPLLRLAYKQNLSAAIAAIPEQQLSDLFNTFEPDPELFSSETVEMLSIAVQAPTFSMDAVVSLFVLFGKAIQICGANVALSMVTLIEDALKTPKGNFSFPRVVKRLFSAISNLPNRVITQHERMIFPIFVKLLTAIIKSSEPLTKKHKIILMKQLDEAVTDFAFKSSPHFGDEIFSKLPDSASELLLPSVLKILPQVKRLVRKTALLNLVTSFLSNPKGLEALTNLSDEIDGAAAFNDCCIQLLSEEFGQGKDEIKRCIKVLVSMNKWMQLIEKRRGACSLVRVPTIRRKVMSLANNGPDPISSNARNLLSTLQKVESHIHTKDRRV